MPFDSGADILEKKYNRHGMPSVETGLQSFPFLWVGMALICLNLLTRLVDKSDSTIKSPLIDDQASQLGFAILAASQKSVCPKIQTYNKIVGNAYYPLGFFWFSYALFNKLRRHIPLAPLRHNPISKAIGNSSPHLDQYIVFIKLISGLIFPIISQVLLLFVGFGMVKGSVIGGLGICISIISLDSLFTSSRYCVSTRNVGLFLYSLCAISLLCSVYYSKYYLSIHMAADIFLYLSLFIGCICLGQSSQRYSQCLVCTVAIFFILCPAYRFGILAVAFLAILFLLNTTKADYFDYLKAHVYNRIHSFNWSRRTYGEWRYKLFSKLTGEFRSAFLKDFFCHEYIVNNFSGPAYYKSNALSLYAVFRIYIISLSALLLLPAITQQAVQSHLILQIFLLSTMLPSLLCLLKPFQDYGASEVYVFGSLPFTNIALLLCLVDASSADNYYTRAILFILGFDACVVVSRYLIKQYNILANSIRLGSEVPRDLAVSATLNRSLINVLSMLNNLRVLLDGYQGKVPIRAMALGVHMSPLVDVMEAYFRNSMGNPMIQSAFKLLDAYAYGFYDDLRGFCVSTKALSNISPDIIIVDTLYAPSKSYISYLLKSHPNLVVFQIAPSVVVLSFNRSLGSYMASLSPSKDSL